MAVSILDQLQDGVTDVAIDKPGPGSEVHLLHMVGSLPMEALERAVTNLRAANIDKQISTDSVEIVDPRFLLIHAWSQHRLDESKRFLIEGFQQGDEFIPGIHSVYITGLPPYYLVGTGEAHDVVAARLLGKQIRVKICDYCEPDTSRLSIGGNDVYYWYSEGDQWRSFGKESNATIQILEALGVQSRQSVGDRLKRFFSNP
jgi:hypothetical protein